MVTLSLRVRAFARSFSEALTDGARRFVRLELPHHTLGIAGVVQSPNRCATTRKIIEKRWDNHVESVSATGS